MTIFCEGEGGAARVPELLAPAGGMDALYAGICGGADAVYLGLGDFNARRGANNFTPQTLEQACRYAHLRGKKIYVTLNTIVLPGEMPAALNTAYAAYAAGADATIVQDLGLAAAIRREIPPARMHFSTQMNIHSASGVQAAAALGAARVTFARELSLAEVSELTAIAHDLGLQTESFVHGAICVCYSGQCFMSSAVGTRSANRGMCAQACRMPYELMRLEGAGTNARKVSSPKNNGEGEGGGAGAGAGTGAGKGGKRPRGDKSRTAQAKQAEPSYLLSPKDMCAAPELARLCETGVDSLKIEGRMKSADYVYSVVSTYRDMLDEIVCNDSPSQFVPSKAQMERLGSVFSRGFTPAYLVSERGLDMMSYTRPNNRGQLVGRVADVAAGKFGVVCALDLSAGDVLEVWTRAGNFTCTITAADLKGVQIGVGEGGALQARTGAKRGRQKGKNRTGAASKDAKRTVWLALPRTAKPPHVGDRVFRVRSAAAAFEGNPLEPKIAVSGHIILKLGQPLALEFSADDSAGNLLGSAAATGDIVEPAISREVEARDVYDHIARMGSTPFALKDLDITLDRGVGIGFSALHKLRARVLDELAEEIIEKHTPATANPGEGEGCSSPAASRGGTRGSHGATSLPSAANFSCTEIMHEKSLLRDARQPHDPHTPRPGKPNQNGSLPTQSDNAPTPVHPEGRVVPEGRGEPIRSAREARVLCDTRVSPAPSPSHARLEVCAIATNPQCARAAKRAGASVYVAALNFARGTAQMCGATCEDVAQAGYPSHAKIVLPVADHDALPGTREAACGADVWQYAAAADAVVAQNLGQLARATEANVACEVGSNLPVTNADAWALVSMLGATCVWLSPELTLAQIKDLLAAARAHAAAHPHKNAPAAGIYVAGAQCLMTTEHCELMSSGPCNQTCDTCVRRRGRWALCDRKGYEFPVVTDALGRTSIYNAVALDTAHALPELARAGITRFMVDSTLMTPEQTAQAVGRVAKAIELYEQSVKGWEGGEGGEGKAIGACATVEKSNKTTTGHLFRPVE